MVDFIDPVGWPAFNVADSCIVGRRAGAALRGREGGATDRVHLTAGPEDAGARLDAFVASRSEIGSRTDAQRLIDAGHVTVDGAAAPEEPQARAGRVGGRRAARGARARAGAVDFEIVYEDDDLLVVDKPAGLVTHPRRGTPARPSRRPCAAAPPAGGSRAGGHRAPPRPRHLRSARGREVGGGPRASSPGCSPGGRSSAATSRSSAGHPDAESGTIDAPLGRDRARRDVVSTRTARGRPAVTHFSVRERLPRTTLLDVRLETGRTHQIRAHLAAIGLPVCGDPRYGGVACGRRLGLDRQFLHAATLMFRHPSSGEIVICESKPPAELRRAIAAARQEPVPGGPDGN